MNRRCSFTAHRGWKEKVKTIALALGASALLAISAGAGMAAPASAVAATAASPLVGRVIASRCDL